MEDQSGKFREIVEEFRERLDEQVEEMFQARRQNDFQRLKKIAHWMKGSGGTAGFEVISTTGKRLEQQAESAQLAEIEATMREIQGLAQSIYIPTAEEMEPAS